MKQKSFSLQLFAAGILLMLSNALSATCTLTANCAGGDWTAASTWTPSGCAAGVTTPGNGCIIIIPACATVVVNINSPVYNNMEIYVYGTLQFDVGQKINMCPGYIEVFPGGQLTGGSPGSKINICGTTVWNGPGTTSGPVSYGGGTTLPIELLSFNAISSGAAVDLWWSTATETNNDFFTIERSSNGNEFTPVAVVDGAGSSTFRIDYAERDYNPLPGVSYYRLRQTDFNGHTTFSAAVPVNYSFGTEGFSIYPNPADPSVPVNMELNVAGDKEVLVVIRDVTGKEFYSKVFITTENNELVVLKQDEEIPAGTYVITATSDNRIFSRKLVIR